VRPVPLPGAPCTAISMPWGRTAAGPPRRPGRPRGRSHAPAV